MPPFTTISRQRQTKTIFPCYDPCRIYTNEHDISVHACGATPSTPTSVELFDLPQRRWYRLKIKQRMTLEEDEEWFVETVMTHIAINKEPFDVIHIDEADNVTYSIEPNIGMPLYRPIVLFPFLPTANYSDITNKQYLRLYTDTCIWKGRNCVYKSLEFDEDIGRMERDIASREILQEYFNTVDCDLLSQYGICPILAIVVEGVSSSLCGILMPNAGVVLDKMRQINIEHLTALLRTVKHLRSAQVIHGDICERNVCIEGSLVQLIDFGEVAPRYQNDIVATGQLLEWCVGRFEFSEEERDRVRRAAIELIDRQYIDDALAILEGQK